MEVSINQKNELCNRRQTAQRALVLEVVRSLHNHPTSAEVFQEASKRTERISRATVYRNLDVLVGLGQLLRIDTPQAPARYDATLKPHGHAFCRSCNKVFDIELNTEGCVRALIARECDFRIESYKIAFEGLCKECAAR